MQELIAVTKNIYTKALKEARLRHIPQAFSLYVDAFLPRLGSAYATEKEFKCFYRWQLASYLLGKKNYEVALPEGDMVSDLILDAYCDFISKVGSSRFNITRDGRINLLSSIKIVFPFCNDELEEDSLE